MVYILSHLYLFDYLITRCIYFVHNMGLNKVKH